MPADDFDPHAPIFSQRDAVEMTNADAATIDNWVRYKHIVPKRVGNRRLFSFFDLLTIDLIHILVRMFRVDITAGAFVARQSAEEYIGKLDDDRADIEAGRPWHSPVDGHGRGDVQIAFTRDVETGELRAMKTGDDQLESVSVILPVRRLARRLLNNLTVWASEHD